MIAEDANILPELEKRITTNEDGTPKEVVIEYQKFVDFIEAHGLDFSEEERQVIQQSRKDFDEGRKENFISLDEI
jgi:hypothetical protein